MMAALGQQLPPVGGMALLAAFLGMGWLFLLVPVLTGSVLLVLLAWGFSRVGQHRGQAGRKLQPSSRG
jgi:CBS-domain-containing membrane protein